MIKDIINTNWNEIMLVSERAIVSLVFLFFMTIVSDSLVAYIETIISEEYYAFSAFKR